MEEEEEDVVNQYVIPAKKALCDLSILLPFYVIPLRIFCLINYCLAGILICFRVQLLQGLYR